MAIGCPICNRRLPPSRARNDLDTKIGRPSLTDAVTDSATITTTTAELSPVNNQNSHPSGGPLTNTATGLHRKPVTKLSAATEAALSGANQGGEDSDEGSKGDWYHPRGQIQVDHQSAGDDEAEEGSYHEVEMKTYDSSEEEEDCYDDMDECSDEQGDEDLEEEEDDDDDDDDEDDDDWLENFDWESHNLFWFGVREFTWAPLPPLKSILKKPAAEDMSSAEDTSSTTPREQAAGDSGRRRVTFRHNMPSYRWEKGANAPDWKRVKSRSPILLGFH